MSDENIEYLIAKLSQIDSGFSTPPTDAKRSLSAFQHSAFANSIAAKPCAEIVHRCFQLFSATVLLLAAPGCSQLLLAAPDSCFRLFP